MYANHPSRGKTIARLFELFKATKHFVTKTFGKILTYNHQPIILAPKDGNSLKQAVSGWYPKAVARVLVRAHVKFVVDKAALRQVFSEYFGFPCQSFYQFLHLYKHPGWHNRQLVAAMPSRPNWTIGQLVRIGFEPEATTTRRKNSNRYTSTVDVYK
jgi:hypothetical protein